MRKKIVTVLLTILLIAAIPLSLISFTLSSAPVYGDTYYGALSTMYDRLKETKGQKIVVIGTSSVAFGINSALAEKELKKAGLDYEVCNFGLYGSLGTKLMLDLSLPYINEGDIVIFSPEAGSQTLSLYFSAKETWRAIDSDFSIFNGVHGQNKQSLVGNFASYASDKYKYVTGAEDMPSGSGVYAFSSFDSRGDLVNYARENNVMPEGVDVNNEIILSEELITDEFSSYVNEYYGKIKKRGATMYYSASPMNREAVSSEEGSVASFLSGLAKFDFPIIGNIENSIMDKEWFYDSNFHLNYSGSVVRSCNLVSDIASVLGKDYTKPTLPSKPESPSEDYTDGDNKHENYFEYEMSEDKYTIIGLKDGAPSELVIPSKHDGLPVTAINRDVLKGNKQLTSLTVSKNIRYLPDGLFDGCSSLKSVTLLHDSPENIGVGYKLLSGAPDGIIIYVDKNSYSKFVNNYFWGNYATSIKGKEINHTEITYTVKVVSDEKIETDKEVYSVTYGGEVIVQIKKPSGGYYFRTSDYTGVEIVNETEEGLTLSLKNITANQVIRIYFNRYNAQIVYYPNGGKVEAGGESYTEFFDTSYRPSVNTNSGVGYFVREGYTQTGWNTRPDYSGTHVGLGSRYDFKDGNVLFAEWEKWTEANYTYTIEKGGDIILTGVYGNDVSTLVIPATIDGRTVSEISSNFACSYKSAVKKVVFPLSMFRIQSGSFYDWNVEEIVFYDNLRYMDGAFGKSVKTFTINAVNQPKYQGVNNNAYFTEKIELLKSTMGQKRLIFFAGCSMSYGLKSALVKNEFADYEVINLGVIGGTSAAVQFDMIIPYLTDKDVFIHAPEIMSTWQLMDSFTIDNRVFIMVEGNYDNFRNVDVSRVEDAYSAWETYARLRLSEMPHPYDRINPDYNSYGDIIIPRLEEGDHVSFNDFDYYVDTKALNENSLYWLGWYYQKIQEKGATVLFSFSPANGSAFDEQKWEDVRTFETFYKTRLSDYGIEVISDIDPYMMNYKYFYDSDYHLNDKGAEVRTMQLISDLKEYFKAHRANEESSK